MNRSPVHSSLSKRTSYFVGSLAVLAAMTVAPAAPAAMLAADDAGNYTSWSNGSNGGSGFGAWDLTGNNNNGSSLFAGYFLGDSTAGTAGNINTGSPSQSFGMYANPNGAFADAARAFSGALTTGQSFTLQMTTAFRNGDKGINLLASGTQVFNFDIGTSGTGVQGYYYTPNGASGATSTGFAYDADSIFTLTYLQQTATTGLITISRTSASGGSAANNSVSSSFTSSGVTSFTLYTSNASNAAGDNFYFNSLAVVPEPSTWAAAALGFASLLIVRRYVRRSNA